MKEEDWPDLVEGMNDEFIAGEATMLAREIMFFTEERILESAPSDHVARLIVLTALSRCLAGLYARLAFDHGEHPFTAKLAMMGNGVTIGNLAEKLCDDAYRLKAERDAGTLQ
ncbi:MAG: hypothetical protein H6851_07670 [Geminicoccaceae bacterium]|nr:hypothetical protein [Geminicoccaceae bacterium]